MEPSSAEDGDDVLPVVDVHTIRGASMEPSSAEDGDSVTRIEGDTDGHSLQWSRPQQRTETGGDDWGGCWCRSLQWSRPQQRTETRMPDSDLLAPTPLQWSRPQQRTETESRDNVQVLVGCTLQWSRPQQRTETRPGAEKVGV